MVRTAAKLRRRRRPGAGRNTGPGDDREACGSDGSEAGGTRRRPMPRRTKSSGAIASRPRATRSSAARRSPTRCRRQINGLYTEFVNMSDPAQRAVIEQKRLAAIAEQDRVKADIAKQTKALADIEDEARRANVPAGWLR